MPVATLSATPARELSLAICFFVVFRLLIVLAAPAVMLLLTGAGTDQVLVVAATAVAVPASVQADRVLARAGRDLADARRAILWATARARQQGGASALDALAGFRLFERWGGWLTSPGRKLARERSLALLAATFDHGEDGPLEGQLARFQRRYGNIAASRGPLRVPSLNGRAQPSQR